jgi:hypothetical protein
MKKRDKPNMPETDKPQEQVTRKEFLKMLGIGAGVVGVSIATGEMGFAALDPRAENRISTQHFIRHLLQEPDKVNEFFQDPQDVAAEFGIKLSDQDVHRIQEGLLKISRGPESKRQTDKPPTTKGQTGSSQSGTRKMRRQGEAWSKSPGFSKFGGGWDHTAKLKTQ